MEKRLILAAVLSVLVIIGYQFLLTKTSPQPAQKTLEKKEVKQMQKNTEGTLAPAASVNSVFKKVDRSGETDVVINTPLYTATLSTIGGGVKSWKLKKYKQEIKSDSKNIEMVSSAEKGLYPFQVFDSNGKPVIFNTSSENMELGVGDKKTLTLKGESKEGLKWEETLTFYGDNYEVDIDLGIKNAKETDYSGTISLNLFKSLKNAKKGRYVHLGPVSYSGKKVLREKTDKLILKSYKDVKWTGLEDKYFIFALIPSQDKEIKVGKTSNELVYSNLLYPVTLAPSGFKKIKLKAYAGPKEVDILEDFGVHLEDTLNFGIFSVIANPLLFVLKFLYRFVGNYGIAIIILTIIIKIIFYPLTFKSLQSMKHMQKMQPQIATLKEKYKDNKEKMNKELMELYKRSKVNPLGGCLPMALQIPVFIALYNVLLLSIELRHAPFFLWINDLSAKDPYYITPIIMGASMLIQQKMSPSAMDPQQAKMMLIMPVVFTFMFLNFPSGLVIYWLVNNILSIAQQYYIHKKV